MRLSSRLLTPGGANVDLGRRLRAHEAFVQPNTPSAGHAWAARGRRCAVRGGRVGLARHYLMQLTRPGLVPIPLPGWRACYVRLSRRFVGVRFGHHVVLDGVEHVQSDVSRSEVGHPSIWWTAEQENEGIALARHVEERGEL